MTTVEHTHTEFTTKDEMSDFKVIVTDMMTQLSQSNLAANARMDRFENRMDRFETRMDRFEDELREIRIELRQNTRSIQELTESNRRAIGFQTSEDNG